MNVSLLYKKCGHCYHTSLSYGILMGVPPVTLEQSNQMKGIQRWCLTNKGQHANPNTDCEEVVNEGNSKFYFSCKIRGICGFETGFSQIQDSIQSNLIDLIRFDFHNFFFKFNLTLSLTVRTNKLSIYI